MVYRLQWLAISFEKWGAENLGIFQVAPSVANQPAPYSGEEKTNKHKQLLGIVPEMGGGSNCFCVSLLLGEKGKHINKFPRKSQEKAGRVPGQSWENPGTIPWKFCLCVFLVCWFFPDPTYTGLSGPSGPKCQKGPQKSPKSFGNSPNRLFRHFPEDTQTCDPVGQLQNRFRASGPKQEKNRKKKKENGLPQKIGKK